ncbi:MAG: hypothetical protein MZV65_36585 [Chromatiales bacterium]|nr:hypothetical protein [Chromatiales bacterium]
MSEHAIHILDGLVEDFSLADAERVKAIEATHQPRRQGGGVLAQGAARRQRRGAARLASSSTSPAPPRTSTTCRTR